ncbi:MAG: LytTR family transcriptional regulator DNA-binding domain-containing protein [Pseudomonadota bacterium]
MKDFLRSYYKRVATPPVVVAWLATSLLTTLSGPFGTYEVLNIAERLVVWTVCTFFAFLIFILVQEGIRAVRPMLTGWRETFAVGAALSVLFTPVLLAATHETAIQTGSDKITTLFVIAAAVFLVPVALTAAAPIWTLWRNSAPDQPTSPRLRRRLGEDAGEILHVTVRDHYVDVLTDTGRSTLLMRFSDALAELEGVAGFRVHRSHWVASEAIRRLEDEGGRLFVRLRCGDRVPVSRGYRDALEDAGLPRKKTPVATREMAGSEA